MSFVKQQLTLRDSPRNTHPMKPCYKCEERKPPEDGMDMGNGRWMCAACWTHRATRRKS